MRNPQATRRTDSHSISAASAPGRVLFVEIKSEDAKSKCNAHEKKAHRIALRSSEARIQKSRTRRGHFRQYPSHPGTEAAMNRLRAHPLPVAHLRDALNLELDALPDDELLERFARYADHPAFEA